MQRKNNYLNTIGYFNFARGICILFVVFGHSATLFFTNTYQQGSLNNVLNNLGAGLMAMLFMVSGFGFRNKKNSKCIKQQAKLCLTPYYITAVCVIGAKLALAVIKHRSFWKYGGEFLSTYLLVINRGYKGLIWGMPTDNIAWTWFLWALFGGWCIYNAIDRLNKPKVKLFLVALCVIIGMSLTLITKVWFYCIPHMLQTTGFIYAGHMIQKHHILEKKLTLPEWLAVLIFSSITLIWGGIDMFTCVWNLFLLDYIGVIAVGFLLLKFFSWIADKEPENFLYKGISVIGYNTLQILCIHTFDSRVIPWHRWKTLFASRPWMGVLTSTLIRIVFIFVACKCIAYINKKFFRKKSKRAKIKIQIDR